MIGGLRHQALPLWRTRAKLTDPKRCKSQAAWRRTIDRYGARVEDA
ncbi:hypothetical protein POHY109586_23645 [Polaromonas hydrogenivorans]